MGELKDTKRRLQLIPFILNQNRRGDDDLKSLKNADFGENTSSFSL